ARATGKCARALAQHRSGHIEDRVPKFVRRRRTQQFRPALEQVAIEAYQNRSGFRWVVLTNPKYWLVIRVVHGVIAVPGNAQIVAIDADPGSPPHQRGEIDWPHDDAEQMASELSRHARNRSRRNSARLTGAKTGIFDTGKHTHSPTLPVQYTGVCVLYVPLWPESSPFLAAPDDIIAGRSTPGHVRG